MAEKLIVALPKLAPCNFLKILYISREENEKRSKCI